MISICQRYLVASSRGTMSETEQQNMEKQPSILSKDRESVNKGETSENVENIGVKTGDYDIDNIRTKENIANTETVNTAEDEST